MMVTTHSLSHLSGLSNGSEVHIMLQNVMSTITFCTYTDSEDNTGMAHEIER